VASISYSIDANGEISIDVQIEDYSLDTIEKFSLLFASIPSKQFQLQAMDILRTAFHNDERYEEFVQFAGWVVVKTTLMNNEFKNNLNKGQKNGKSDEPIIKPTDLL
jgi:hypothetical protein